MLTLCVTGFDSDPGIVTEILRLEPTSLCRIGDAGRSGRPRNFNAWWLEVHPDRLKSGQEHATALKLILTHLRGRENDFARLHAELSPTDVSIYGGLYMLPDEQCGIWLDSADMMILSRCGVGWGLDIFVDE